MKQNKVLELRLTKNLVGFVQLFPLFQTKSGAFYYSVAELIENLTPCLSIMSPVTALICFDIREKHTLCNPIPLREHQLVYIIFLELTQNETAVSVQALKTFRLVK